MGEASRNRRDGFHSVVGTFGTAKEYAQMEGASAASTANGLNGSLLFNWPRSHPAHGSFDAADVKQQPDRVEAYLRKRGRAGGDRRESLSLDRDFGRKRYKAEDG